VDFGTLVGILLGFALIGSAIAAGGELISFLNPQGFLIVVGGTLAATIVRYSFRRSWGAVKVARRAFEVEEHTSHALVRHIVELSQLARRESVLALDSVDIQDPFLAKGIQLAVDGTDPRVIESILSSELVQSVERHRNGQRVFMGMGESAPAFGMIGTLVGLVHMLTNMNDPTKIGPAMAVALITTLYGAIMANLIFLPIADKLADRTRRERIRKEIVIQGVDCLMSGIHPRVIEEKLVSYLAPVERNDFQQAA
jgi:chemotaxis protein MotA